MSPDVIVIGNPLKKSTFMSLMSQLSKDQWNEIPSVPNYLSPLDVQAKWDARIGKNNVFSVGLVCSELRHANDAARV